MVSGLQFPVFCSLCGKGVHGRSAATRLRSDARLGLLPGPEAPSRLLHPACTSCNAASPCPWEPCLSWA